MIKFDRWWFPDGETNLPDEMVRVGRFEEDLEGQPRLTYQYQKYDVCVSKALAPWRRRVAIDVGAHVGLWSYWMQRDFTKVLAFEPARDHRLCFSKNVDDAPGYLHNVTMFPVGLGATHGWATLQHRPTASGGSYIVPPMEPALSGITSSVPIHRLDDYTIPVCDFLKIDVEGYELDVVQGAAQFLQRTKPVIIMETIPDNANRYGRDIFDAVHFVEELGAHVVVRLGHHDLIMDWER